MQLTCGPAVCLMALLTFESQLCCRVAQLVACNSPYTVPSTSLPVCDWEKVAADAGVSQSDLDIISNCGTALTSNACPADCKATLDMVRGRPALVP